MDVLVDNLRAAQGGSRELDELIGRLLGWRHTTELGPKVYGLDWWMPPGSEDLGLLTDLPHYTTSLDAALTLVAEDVTFEIWRSFKGIYHAEIGKGDEQKGATLALALCIVALQAYHHGNLNPGEIK